MKDKMKKLTLIFLLSSSLIFASNKEDQNTQPKNTEQNAEQEYISCIARVEQEAKNFGLNESWRLKLSLPERLAYLRYNQQCNKCLTTYAFNQARTLLKLFLKK